MRYTVELSEREPARLRGLSVIRNTNNGNHSLMNSGVSQNSRATGSLFRVREDMSLHSMHWERIAQDGKLSMTMW